MAKPETRPILSLGELQTSKIDKKPGFLAKINENLVTTCEGGTLCSVKIWFATTAALVVAVIVFASLYGISTRSHSNEANEVDRLQSTIDVLETCRLTYTDHSAISEDEMQDWVAKDDWLLSVPEYDESKRACVCPSSNTGQLIKDYSPVWMAPGDIASLALDGIINVSQGFISEYNNSYLGIDHVKVCLEENALIYLWDDAKGRLHCHGQIQLNGSSILRTRPYLGWDGALYCAVAMSEGEKILRFFGALIAGAFFKNMVTSLSECTEGTEKLYAQLQPYAIELNNHEIKPAHFIFKIYQQWKIIKSTFKSCSLLEKEILHLSMGFEKCDSDGLLHVIEKAFEQSEHALRNIKSAVSFWKNGDPGHAGYDVGVALNAILKFGCNVELLLER